MALPRSHAPPSFLAHAHAQVAQSHYRKKKRGIPLASGGAHGHTGDARSRLLGHVLAQEEDFPGTPGGGSSRDASEEDNDAPSEQSDSASSIPRSHAPSTLSPTSLHGTSIADLLPNNARDRAVAGAKGHVSNGTHARRPERSPTAFAGEKDRELLQHSATGPNALGVDTPSVREDAGALGIQLLSDSNVPPAPTEQHSSLDLLPIADELGRIGAAAHGAPAVDGSALASQAKPDATPADSYRTPATLRKLAASSSPPLTDCEDLSDGGTASPYDGDVEFAARTPVSHQPSIATIEPRAGCDEKSTARSDHPWFRQIGDHAPSTQRLPQTVRQPAQDREASQTSVVSDPPTRAYASFKGGEAVVAPAHDETRDTSQDTTSAPLTPEPSAAAIQDWTIRLNQHLLDDSKERLGTAETALYVQVAFDVASLADSTSYLRTAKLGLGEHFSPGQRQRGIKIIAGVVADGSEGSGSALATELPLRQRAQLARSSRWVDEVIEGVPYHSSLDASARSKPSADESRSISRLLEEVGAQFAAVAIGVQVDASGAEAMLPDGEHQAASPAHILRLPSLDQAHSISGL